MNLDFRVLTGNDASHSVMLWGPTIEYFEANDAESALKVLSADGWRFFAKLEPDGNSWRILIARPPKP